MHVTGNSKFLQPKDLQCNNLDLFSSPRGWGLGTRLDAAIRDNILRVCGLETAPDTIKMAETIIVMPCCAGKSRQPNSTIPFHYV